MSESESDTTAPPASASPTTTTASSVPEPGPFHGSGAENLGTVHVPANTILHWSCPDCGPSTLDGTQMPGDNFQIFNSDVTSAIAVNALGQTSGQTVVDAGTYHDVTVNTEGNEWTITFSHS